MGRSIQALMDCSVTGQRILVAEDDDDLRETLREVLEDEGYHVKTAADGHEALDRLRSGATPDLIVVDLMMPVMDGWTMISELKKDPALASIPVIAVTQGGDKALMSSPVVAGYLSKPIGRRTLLQTISACLERKKK